MHTEWICPKVEERNRASGEGRELIVNQIFENIGSTLKLQNLRPNLFQLLQESHGSVQITRGCNELLEDDIAGWEYQLS